MLSSLRVSDAKREEGFTLIELLVVVIIIGILAAIAIPTFLSQRQRGWQAAITSDVRNAALEVEADYTSRAGANYVATQALFEALFTPPITTFPEGNLAYTTGVTSTNAPYFCIVGTDTRVLTGGAPTMYTYNSASNGMQPVNTPCIVP